MKDCYDKQTVDWVEYRDIPSPLPEDYDGVQVCGKWYVRPRGQLGSCGFAPWPWEIRHVPGASSAEEAVNMFAESLKRGNWGKRR